MGKWDPERYPLYTSIYIEDTFKGPTFPLPTFRLRKVEKWDPEWYPLYTPIYIEDTFQGPTFPLSTFHLQKVEK